jgi:hypothetical protein
MISKTGVFPGGVEMPNGASPYPKTDTSTNCPGLCPNGFLSSSSISKRLSTSLKVYFFIVALRGDE